MKGGQLCPTSIREGFQCQV